MSLRSAVAASKGARFVQVTWSAIQSSRGRSSAKRKHKSSSPPNMSTLPSFQSGSMPSSILSGTPLAPSILAACPSTALSVDPRFTFGLSLLIGVALFVVRMRGLALAFDALSDAPPECTECCDDVRGDTRPFCVLIYQP